MVLAVLSHWTVLQAALQYNGTRAFIPGATQSLPAWGLGQMGSRPMTCGRRRSRTSAQLETRPSRNKITAEANVTYEDAQDQQ